MTGGKFMGELHLKQSRFPYSVCRLFTKHHQRIKKFRETGNLKHLCRNELDKASFVHDGAYSDSKDWTKITISYKISKDRTYEIVDMIGIKEH